MQYDFVECYGMSGRLGSEVEANRFMTEKNWSGIRGSVLYGLDKSSDIRFSHENPSVIKCYEDFLDAPLSHKAHELLHTCHFKG